MISIRSALARSIVKGRGGSNSAAALMQANVAFPSSDRTTEDNKNASVSVRNFASPAYKRFLKQQTGTIKGSKPAIPAYEMGVQTPSLRVASDMAKGFSEMENEPLLVIAEMGNHKARMEVLRRHIMVVDGIQYEEASVVLEQIAAKNSEGKVLASVPYYTAIVAALGLGVGAIPMVFNIDVALSFNNEWVTMEVPPPSELDTFLETGAWTWNWMEPVLGTLSFTLLCFQNARSQIQHLGLRPFTGWLIERRAQNLFAAFPHYDESMLQNFVETDAMAKWQQ
mmetsp:Transcript_20254/g.42089  ORF Transcript_20254/g.42089 Transcript_20254/m.42089 type:complete len:282 (+) Transcript_20254:261-1106(+)